jgi:hypothetical protein
VTPRDEAVWVVNQRRDGNVFRWSGQHTAEADALQVAKERSKRRNELG